MKFDGDATKFKEPMWSSKEHAVSQKFEGALCFLEVFEERARSPLKIWWENWFPFESNDIVDSEYPEMYALKCMPEWVRNGR